MQRTKKEIGDFLKMLKVPNIERLETKSENFIFDLGVYMISPFTSNKTMDELRFHFDTLLNYNSFEEATEALDKKQKNVGTEIQERIKQMFPGAEVRVATGAEGLVEALKKIIPNGENHSDEFEADLKRASELSAIEKISKILAHGNKLGKNVSDAKYYDALHDLSIEHPEYLDVCFVGINDIMKTDHYKECGCVAVKYDMFVFSKSKREFVEKIHNRNL
jgi:hypothetical protein